MSSMRRTPTGGSTASEEDYGQGWVQLTDTGKIYLSKKEKNVFILEGTTAAGFAGCSYSGSIEERDLVNSGEYSLTCELKCVPGDHCPDHQVFLLLDCLSVGELSSGCDFLGVHLACDSHDLRVERHRRNMTKQTLYAQPNCVLLKPHNYVTVCCSFVEDALSVTINGVSVLASLPLDRPPAPRPAWRVGLAVYGRSRCYMRRFRVAAVSPATQAAAAAASSSAACRQDSSTALSVMTATASSGSKSSRRANGASALTPTSNVCPSAQPMGLLVPQQVGNSQAGEEMEMAAVIERDIVVADLNVRFDDVGGLDDAKRAINEAVVLPLLIPEFFIGIRKPWKGVLLYGPPGTGKTMLAKAVASSVENVTFFNCSAATLTSKWRGESEKLLRALFKTARARVPSILFFDEIDSLLSQRGASAEHEASRRFKSEFLIHMDGLLSDMPAVSTESPGHLLVLATSNAPWDLDEALRRRLEKRIYIPLPDKTARRRMFEGHLKDIRVGDDVNLDLLADRTDGYSGADVQLICRDASMNPMRRMVDGLSPTELVQLRNEGKLTPSALAVEMNDFDAALANVQPSVSTLDTERYLSWAHDFGST